MGALSSEDRAAYDLMVLDGPPPAAMIRVLIARFGRQGAADMMDAYTSNLDSYLRGGRMHPHRLKLLRFIFQERPELTKRLEEQCPK
jgi:hypothetical protein